MNVSASIDARIAALDDWRGAMLALVRLTILAADPAIVEEWKWRGTPVWSRAGIVCTGESYRDKIKLTLAHGAVLPDPTGLFNASMEGKLRPAIDLFEGVRFDAEALATLVRAAVVRSLASRTSVRS